MRPDAGIKAVVFDFDGTLVDSNAIKRQAYDEAFQYVPGAGEQITAALKKYPAGDRHFIIAFVVAQLQRKRNLSIIQAGRLTRSAIRAYSRFCRQEVSVASDFPGVTTTLRQLARKYRLAVNSGTQQDQLRSLVRRRSWGIHCELILGSPSTKVRNLVRIAHHFKIAPEQIVLVGDSPVDADAAAQFGCAFIYAAHQPQATPLPWRRVRTLRELPRAISQLNG